MKGNVNSRWGRRPASGRRGRHAAKSRLSRLLALLSGLAISGGMIVALAPAASAVGETETAHLKSETIQPNDNGCADPAWAGVHFVLTNLVRNEPQSISVVLWNGSEGSEQHVTADLWKTAGGVAHYNYWFTQTTKNLRVKDATAVVPLNWQLVKKDGGANGQFNISHCWEGDVPEDNGNPPVPSNDAIVTLSKVWSNGVSGDAVGLSIGGAGIVVDHAGSSSVDDESDGIPATATVTAGTSITLSESFDSEPQGEYTTTLECAVDNEDFAEVSSLNGLSATFAVPEDAEAVDCRFTNSGKSETTTPTSTETTAPTTTETTAPTTTGTTAQIEVLPSNNVEAVTPPIEVKGVSQELPPAPAIAVKPAAQVAPAPSANAHTGQGQSPWAYLLFGAGALLLLGAWRVRRNGNA